MMKPRPIQFGAQMPYKPVKLLARNATHIMGDFLYGKIHDIQHFKDNAFILSSLIQVLSRIYVANRSAKETQGTKEGPYRYLEAVRTTFREALGFFLSYVVLRTLQRGTVDFFRNFLRVSGGITKAPGIFNPLFKRWFKVPNRLLPKPDNYFPGFLQTAQRLGQQVTSYFKNGPLAKVELKEIKHLYPDLIKNRGILLDKSGMPQYKRIEWLVNWVNRIAGKDLKLAPAKKLETFFDYFPILFASIPTLLLSGLWLERFSQRKAEPIAQRIARTLSKQPRQGFYDSFDKTFAQYPMQIPASLDRSPSLPYAIGNPTPVHPTGLSFHGPSFSSGPQPITNPWLWGDPRMPGYGFGSPAPY